MSGSGVIRSEGPIRTFRQMGNICDPATPEIVFFVLLFCNCRCATLPKWAHSNQQSSNPALPSPCVVSNRRCARDTVLCYGWIGSVRVWVGLRVDWDGEPMVGDASAIVGRLLWYKSSCRCARRERAGGRATEATTARRTFPPPFMLDPHTDTHTNIAYTIALVSIYVCRKYMRVYVCPEHGFIVLRCTVNTVEPCLTLLGGVLDAQRPEPGDRSVCERVCMTERGRVSECVRVRVFVCIW